MYELVDTGTYTARLIEVTPENGQYGPQLKLRFRLESGAILTAWASATLSERTKLGSWTRAVLGYLPDELDTDALIDRECRLSVVVKTREDGSEYNKVDEVLPLRARQGGPRAPAGRERTCAECGAPAECHTPDGRGWCDAHAPVELPV